MARQDPVQAFIAQGVSSEPVGALDELKAHNLPTRVFHSCSEPANDGSNKGCPHWYDCTMSYKGLDAKDGGGPRAHCWERIKSPAQGGGIVRNVQPCYWGVAQQDIAQQNDEVLRVIADEGEPYEMLTTVPDPTKGRDQNGALNYETKLLKLEVPKFKRLGEEQKLASHELRASIMQREKEKMQNERAARILGVEGAATPLDKRGRGGSDSKAAKG